MKKFHFSKVYFNKLIFNDEKSKIRVVVKETPSLEVTEEGYSLRVETRHDDKEVIHRNYAIEHHLDQLKHSYPHLQFKFHTEEIGTFRIRLDFENQEEYEKAILGFIYKIKNVLLDLEKFRKGITDEILVLEQVNKLNIEEEFLTKKIYESITNYKIEFDGKDKLREKHNMLENNVVKIVESYKK
jgi:hypothetical protein